MRYRHLQRFAIVLRGAGRATEQSGRSPAGGFRPRFRGAASAALLALALPAGAQSFLGLSPEEAKRFGREQHPKVVAQFGGAYEDPALVRYVDSIGQFLAAASHAPRVGYTFTVLDSPIVNAFALPGGYVYVTRGLLALADSEAEVAGVLAHEIAHITARHGSKRQSKGTLAGLGLTILGAVTDNPALVNLGRVGAHAVLSAYSRKEEHEADEIGVRYLSRAGFEPGAMSSFLSKLKRQSEFEASLHGRSPRPGLDFFATHPRTPERVARSVEAARRTSVADPITARDIYLSKIDGLLYGDGPEQGFVRGRRFVHPVIRFAFEVPRRYRLLNGERSITAFGPEDAKMHFDLQKIEPGLPRGRYLRKVWAPQARITHLEREVVNGMNAVTALARAGRNQWVRVAVIRFRRDTVARFAFIPAGAPDSRADRRHRRAVHSFRRLSWSEAREARPWRIEVREVEPGDTVRSLVDWHFAPGVEQPHRLFRLLNGLPRGEPRPGDRVKLVVEEWPGERR